MGMGGGDVRKKLEAASREQGLDVQKVHESSGFFIRFLEGLGYYIFLYWKSFHCFYRFIIKQYIVH